VCPAPRKSSGTVVRLVRPKKNPPEIGKRGANDDGLDELKKKQKQQMGASTTRCRIVRYSYFLGCYNRVRLPFGLPGGFWVAWGLFGGERKRGLTMARGDDDDYHHHDHGHGRGHGHGHDLPGALPSALASNSR
jgi:hypothetical protein